LGFADYRPHVDEAFFNVLPLREPQTDTLLIRGSIYQDMCIEVENGLRSGRRGLLRGSLWLCVSADPNSAHCRIRLLSSKNSPNYRDEQFHKSAA